MPVQVDTQERKARRLASKTIVQPGEFVKYLFAGESKDPAFMKTLILAELLTWAVLDQEPGQRAKKAPTENQSAGQGRPSAGRDRPIKVHKALYAGNHVLALLLHRQRKLQRRDETTKLLNELLEARTGVGGFAWAPAYRELYEEARESERELHYVYWIVSYLCRCEKHALDASKFTIENAKRYTENWAPEGKNTYGESAIEKIWLKYRKAAPFIFGFYPFLRGLKKGVSRMPVLNAIEALALDQPRLTQLIGRAAYAADVLKKRRCGARISDFNDIPRAEPLLRSFSPPEKDVIDSLDRKAPIP
jgi:hypothetical protein